MAKKTITAARTLEETLDVFLDVYDKAPEAGSYAEQEWTKRDATGLAKALEATAERLRVVRVRLKCRP